MFKQICQARNILGMHVIKVEIVVSVEFSELGHRQLFLFQNSKIIRKSYFYVLFL